MERPHVARPGAGSQPLHRDPTAGDRGGGEPVAGGAGVGFDGVLGRRGRGRGDAEGAGVVFDPHAEVRQNAGGHGDVGRGDEFPRHPQRDGAARGGGGHQQGGEELAAGAALDGRRAAPQAGRLHHDRRAAGAGVVGAFAPHVRPQRVQGRREVADRALPHAVDAVQPVRPPPGGGDQGREEPQARAAVLAEQLGLPHRQFPAAPADDGGLRGGVVGDGDAEGRQAPQHHAGVGTVEHAGQHAGALRQGRDGQGPVRQRLAARRAHRPRHRPPGRRDRQRVGERVEVHGASTWLPA